MVSTSSCTHKKTVQECVNLCDADPSCKAFEYGVNHGGMSLAYNAGDCQLQSSADSTGCDGLNLNLDLYVKKLRTNQRKVWSTEGNSWLIYTTREMAAGYTTISGSANYTNQWSRLTSGDAWTIQYMFRKPAGTDSMSCDVALISSYCEIANFNNERWTTSSRRRHFGMNCVSDWQLQPDGMWHWMTVTFVRGSLSQLNIKYYVDGVERRSQLHDNYDSIALDGQICFGGGHVDRVASLELAAISIWDRELPMTMMAGACSVAVTTEGLIAYYPLDVDFRDLLGGRSMDPGYRNGDSVRNMTGAFTTVSDDFPTCEAQYCVKILTLSGHPASGTLDVSIDTGGGFIQEASGAYASLAVVLDRCYDIPVLAVQVHNPTDDGWIGSISYSNDGGDSYSNMICIDCTGTTSSSDAILVDGDSDGALDTTTRCTNGATCTLHEKAAPTGLVINGFCTESEMCNGEYSLLGSTASSAPYYKNIGEATYIYYDPDCNGGGTAGRWICDNSIPDVLRANDLDSDGDCSYHARIDSPDTTGLPIGENTWRVYCGSSFIDVLVRVETTQGTCLSYACPSGYSIQNPTSTTFTQANCCQATVAMTLVCEDCAECDWDGADSANREALGGGGHSASECESACIASSMCNYAAFSSLPISGFCHMTATCNAPQSGSGWTRWKKAQASVVLQNVVANGLQYTKNGGGYSYNAYAFWEASSVCVKADQTDKYVRVGLTTSPFDSHAYPNGKYVGLFPSGRLYRPPGTDSVYNVTDVVCLYVLGSDIVAYKNGIELQTWSGSAGSGTKYAKLWFYEDGAKLSVQAIVTTTTTDVSTVPSTSTAVEVSNVPSTTTKAASTTFATSTSIEVFGYLQYERSCVNKENIRLYPQKTVEECALLCDADPSCKAFEYGVNHGGASTSYNAADCNLQSSSNRSGCNGFNFNLDLYVKAIVPTTITDVSTTKGVVVAFTSTSDETITTTAEAITTTAEMHASTVPTAITTTAEMHASTITTTAEMHASTVPTAIATLTTFATSTSTEAATTPSVVTTAMAVAADYRTITHTITVPNLDRFLNTDELKASYKTVVAVAAGAAHSDATVYIEKIALEVRLKISNPAPSEWTIQISLAEHTDVSSNMVTITSQARRLRARRLVDALFIGEVDASADPQFTDMVQSAKQIHAKLQDQEALQSIIAEKEGRAVTLSSLSSAVKIDARSVVATPISAGDLHSSNFSFAVEQALGGTISEQSMFDGIILPPSTSIVDTTAIVTTSGAVVGPQTNSGGNEEDASSSMTVVLIVAILVGLFVFAVLVYVIRNKAELPSCYSWVLALVLYVRKCFRKCTRRPDFNADLERLEKVETHLQRWRPHEDKIEALMINCSGSVLSLDTEKLMLDFAALQAVLPKTQQAYLRTAATSANLVTPTRSLSQQAQEQLRKLLRLQSGSGELLMQSISSTTTSKQDLSQQDLRQALHEAIINEMKQLSASGGERIEKATKRLEELSRSMDDATVKQKLRRANEIKRMMETVKKELEFEHHLNANQKRVLDVAVKIREVEAKQEAANAGTWCVFWFVDANRLRDCKEEVLPNFQALQEREMTWLVRRPITFEEACYAAFVEDTLVISHRWEDPKEPDESGVQLLAIREHLIQNPKFRYVWYDFWCMPQGKKTALQKQEFGLMLKNVNMLYLGASVLLLVDMSYVSRFWTQFEAWLSLQKATLDGLVGAQAKERRCSIRCLHNAPEYFEGMVIKMWGNKTTMEAKSILEKPDVTVTNQGDKVIQLQKVECFDERVKTIMQGRNSADVAAVDVAPDHNQIANDEHPGTWGQDDLTDKALAAQETERLLVNLDISDVEQTQNGDQAMAAQEAKRILINLDTSEVERVQNDDKAMATQEAETRLVLLDL